MGTDMSSVDAPFGFVPYGPVLRVNRYAVNTAPVINVCVGDMVIGGGAIVSTPKGYLGDIADAAVPDGGAGVIGAVVAIEDEDGAPLNYIEATRVGNGTIAGYVMVADHPDQMYLAQEDGGGNAIDLAEGQQNADVICATLCAPDSNTYRSTQQIDSSSATTDADVQIKLIRPHEDDTPANDTNCYCRWVCMVNEALLADSIAGV
jgi:hypothetical protein